MLTLEELQVQNTMPTWDDISLSLYKEYSIEVLFPKTFRYYLENDAVIDVQFKEWAMKHLWSLHHIGCNVKNTELFSEIDNGLSFEDFTKTSAMKKRFYDNKDRIRMFACVYHILETGGLFYVKDGILEGTEIRVDYFRSKIISTKGVNLGMRFEEDVYVPLTMLIDRAINPTKTIDGLQALRVKRLEIVENGTIIKTITYPIDEITDETVPETEDQLPTEDANTESEITTEEQEHSKEPSIAETEPAEQELLQVLSEAEADVEDGNVAPMQETFDSIREELNTEE